MVAIARSAVLACALMACGGEAIEPEPDETPHPVVTPPAPPPPSPPPRPSYVYSSQRCGECHEAAFTEWQGSPHSLAATAPAFVAARTRAGDRAGECARCHAPLAAWVPPADPVVAEGVHCDGCHVAAAVEVGPSSAELDLRASANVKYGPLCDAHDHYFHRMGCSDLQTNATLCAGCHHLVRSVNGVEIPIYSEYGEWRDGPYAADDIQCQSCHMPQAPGVVATGSEPRDAISQHGFFGAAGDLRARALEMTATARGSGSRIELSIGLRNRRAGHRVPSGMPGRMLVVSARVMAAPDVLLARSEYTIRRTLVGEDGLEAPHHEAVRVDSDNRIAPRETRTIPLELTLEAAGDIEIAVRWREMSDELARILNVASPREQLLIEGHIEAGPPAAHRRFGRLRITPAADQTP